MSSEIFVSTLTFLTGHHKFKHDTCARMQISCVLFTLAVHCILASTLKQALKPLKYCMLSPTLHILDVAQKAATQHNKLFCHLASPTLNLQKLGSTHKTDKHHLLTLKSKCQPSVALGESARLLGARFFASTSAT
jgi:hypothetical protein